jgi:hypothetical protein
VRCNRSITSLVTAVLTIAGLVFPASAAASTSWTAMTAPIAGLSPSAGSNPFPPASELDPSPGGMSCPTGGSCVQVGTYADASGHVQGLIETLSGGGWAATTAPLNGLSPPAGANPNVSLSTVSCPESGSCAAVGAYTDTSGATQGLIETLAGGSWSATAAPLSGLNPPAGTTPNASLFTVSCPASGSCVAVGSYSDSSGHGEGLIETLAGGIWSATTAPLSGLSPSAGTFAFLIGVACASTGACAAVGQYSDSSGNGQGLIETLTGGTWSATTTPLSGLSPAAGTNPAVFVRVALSCPAIGWCVAMERYTDSSGNVQGLIVTLAGGSWSATTAPMSGLSPPAGANSLLFFSALSCPAAGSCVGVGEYADTSGHPQGVIEVLTHGTWTPTTAPLDGLAPPSSGPAVSLDAVSCPATGSCVAVGTYTDTSANVQGLIETLAGGGWSATTAPLSGLSPATGTNPNVSFRALSCPVTGSCAAFGKYTDTSGNQQGLLETVGVPPPSPPTPPPAPPPPPPPNASSSYWTVASDGGVFSFGPKARFYGSMGGVRLNKPIVGMATAPGGSGYYEVASDGGVFCFGPGATFYGSMAGHSLNKAIVAIAPVATGGGYYLFAADGGVFAFGPNATSYGSMGGTPLNAPIVGGGAASNDHGYYMVASDGGIFRFGPGATFYGSMGGKPLNAPMVGMAVAPDGQGYWTVAADGGIFTFGPHAFFFDSMGGKPLNALMVGMVAAPNGQGYWTVASDGGIFSFGSAQFTGSMGGKPLNAPVIGMATPGAG